MKYFENWIILRKFIVINVYVTILIHMCLWDSHFNPKSLFQTSFCISISLLHISPESRVFIVINITIIIINITIYNNKHNNSNNKSINLLMFDDNKLES